MKPLRGYQASCVASVFAAQRRGVQRVLYTLPTGCGKTRVFSEIVSRSVTPGSGRPALVLAHREELLSQAIASLQAEMPDAIIGLEQGANRASALADVIVASVPTLAREGRGTQNGSRLDWLAERGPAVLVYDEAHHVASDGGQSVLERFGCYAGRTFLVGCTATPKRLDRRALVGPEGAATFEEVVFSYSLLEAISEGWLSDVKGFRVQTETDLSTVATRAGDFAAHELADAVDNEKRTAAVFTEWKRVASDRQTIVFAASIEHAEHAAAYWRAQGVNAEAVHGGLSLEERRLRIARFRSGEIPVLTNCQILTEGFDHPPTACIVLLRPTKSWSLYVQMVGRGTRIAPGKSDLIVLDVVDNVGRHSLCTTASLLDLPDSLDLQGRSIVEAHRRLAELDEKRGYLPPDYVPRTFADLLTTLSQVDLFREIAPRPECESSKFHWLWTPHTEGSRYVVSCGTNHAGEKRRGSLTQDAIGGWHLQFTVGAESSVPYPIASTPDDFPAFAEADAALVETWPDAGRVAGRFNRWRLEPASEAQKALLLRKGIAATVVAAMTKGEASALLDRVC